MLFAYLKADFKKLKGTGICLAHLIIPVLVAAVFLIYYKITKGNVYLRAEAYFQILGIAFPFLTGIFSGMLSEQELMAGSFQNMLSVPVRIVPFYSKILMLLLLGTPAVMLASVLFGTGYLFIAEEYTVDFKVYFIIASIIAGSSIFLYILHLFLAMCFDKGLTTWLGIVESLFAALMLTGLGDGIWMYIPPAWAARFVTLVLPKPGIYGTITGNYNQGVYTAAVICIITTTAGAVAYGIWALKWDGAKPCG